MSWTSPQRFGVSASTVRRDLQRLSGENAVRRTYGGAILTTHGREATLGERQAVQGAEKRAIALAALASIEDGETLILDAGSTVMALGMLLRGRRLSIVTNNVALLPFLAGEPGIEVTVLGGGLRANSMGTVGPLAIDALAAHHRRPGVHERRRCRRRPRAVRGEPRPGGAQEPDDGAGARSRGAGGYDEARPLGTIGLGAAAVPLASRHRRAGNQPAGRRPHRGRRAGHDRQV